MNILQLISHSAIPKTQEKFSFYPGMRTETNHTQTHTLFFILGIALALEETVEHFRENWLSLTLLLLSVIYRGF